MHCLLKRGLIFAEREQEQGIGDHVSQAEEECAQDAAWQR
jgi:hypothetical protein